MKHLGDITEINGQDVPAVNIVVGGSPCQDLSVAGKREGLAGQRSGLFMEQIRIIKEMRENDRANRGFPLVYSRCGCKPVWASEIEEFPIAVTKIRFPDND